MGRIYKISNDINDKLYIGQTTQTLQRRFTSHCCSSNDKAKNMYIKRAILKYGKEHFKIELIEECDDSLLDEREIYWINYFDSYNNGYNLTIGGNSNRNLLNQSIENRIDIDEFKNFVLNYNPTVNELIDKYNICYSTVYNLIRKLNLNISLRHGYRIGKELSKQEKIELLDLYNSGWSIKMLVKRYHVKKSKISNYLHSLGITPRRSYTDYSKRKKHIEYNISTSVQTQTDNAEG